MEKKRPQVGEDPSKVTDGVLRFAPTVLARLGEELIPHPEVGIAELVRNAYDADASRCSVLLKGTTREGGAIVVQDDGCGMSLHEILDGWLILGRSLKQPSRRTS